MKYRNIMSNKKKSAANNLIPGNVFHPGEILREEIESRGLRQVDLVAALGLSKTEVSLIINGKRNITVPVAIKLESLLGIEAEVWMNLQVKYEIDVVKLKHKKELLSKTVPLKKRASLQRIIATA